MSASTDPAGAPAVTGGRSDLGANGRRPPAGDDGGRAAPENGRRDRGLLLTVPARERGERDEAQRTPLQRFFGSRPAPEPSSMRLVEPPEPGKTGICCSGGGIRSAAYNLGALQSMQESGELARSEYLSAVSGGSYIAASFCMVANDRDRRFDSYSELLDADHPPYHPNSPEEQYLRNRSSYMAPDARGKIFLGFRVLMGLAFNLAFLGLPVFVVGVLLAELLYDPAYGNLVAACRPGAEDCDAIADVPAGAWWLLGATGIAVVAAGLVALLVRFHHDRVRLAVERATVSLIYGLALLAVVLVAVPVVVAALFGVEDPTPTIAQVEDPAVPAAGGAGLGALLLGALALARERLWEIIDSEQAERRFTQVRKLSRNLRLAAAYVVGALVGPALLLLIGTYAIAVTLTDTGVEMPVLALVLAAVFGGLYVVADLNTWSLHPLYRRRLCSAFALRRVGTKDRPEAEERRFDRLMPLSESAVTPAGTGGHWPTLLVCAAANVSDQGATPPGRGVTSFTFSPTAIGGPLIGGAATKDFEAALGSNRKRDITLPAAVAMSGAALAPSMGKLTRKPFTFLLGLANLRLGVWVPNPRHIHRWNQRQPLGPMQRGLRRRRAARSWNDEERMGRPRDIRRAPRPHYLLRELLGRHRVDAPFLYVSDGGHYDNLGLVELLRRGCTRIYCFDASGGRTAKELGDAIALARSELGVEITFDGDLRAELYESGTPPLAKRCCVVGRIAYPVERDPDSPGYGKQEIGWLVYASTVMTGDVSWDVAAYREIDPRFPHHSTIDQLYTDQKFEAYRALGRHAGRTVQAAMADATAPPAPAPEPEPAPAVAAGDGAAALAAMPVVTRFEGLVQERTRFVKDEVRKRLPVRERRP